MYLPTASHIAGSQVAFSVQCMTSMLAMYPWLQFTLASDAYVVFDKFGNRKSKTPFSMSGNSPQSANTN